MPGVCAMPAASSASSGMFGRLAVAFGIHISVRHAPILPSPVDRAFELRAVAAGLRDPSRARPRAIHCTRTGRPTALDSSAASAAASSWPFIP